MDEIAVLLRAADAVAALERIPRDPARRTGWQRLFVAGGQQEPVAQ